MAYQKLTHQDVGLPDHFHGAALELNGHDVSLFDLSSHAQAQKAIEFGLKLHRQGFHIYVIGEERSGRTSTTMAVLRNYSRQFPPPLDWVYLNNFSAQERPLAFALSAGMGQKLRGHMTAMLNAIQASLFKNLENQEMNDLFQRASRSLEDDFSLKIKNLRKKALEQGFDILKNEEGQFFIIPKDELETEEATSGNASVEKEEELNEIGSSKVVMIRTIQDELTQIGQEAQSAGEAFLASMRTTRSDLAKKVIEPYCKDLFSKFSSVAGFSGWVEKLQKDLLTNFEEFLLVDNPEQKSVAEAILQRYAVNVLVDHSGHPHAPVVVVSHPSYENLFGSIKYRAGSEGVETDFTLIQAGALHKANGGILVIHADALAQQREVWDFLKRAIRDREIRIEEFHRQHGMPMMLAPEPQPVPLDVQVVLIGAPWWFDDFYAMDPEFRSYFKIRAEIELSMPATLENIQVYAALINQWTKDHLEVNCDESAIRLIMGHSSRWASHRQRLSARFELVGDMLREAKVFMRERGAKVISGQDINSVFMARRERKAMQFLMHIDEMVQGRILLQTDGAEVGQINALTVLTGVDNTYGVPARVTARTFAAKEGVVSIERSIEMSGSIQDKGVMILSGYLNGLLGQEFPLTFGCSITFEQLYVPIDGDSASLAELIAILSSLSGLPIQQNIAVTGSIDQHGNIQAVGGTHQKIEGFYELCKARGLTGTQGVIVPEANRYDLAMWHDVAASVEKGEFHIWSVSNIADVTPLLLNAPLTGPDGVKQKRGSKAVVTEESVVGRVRRQLMAYAKLLKNE